MQQEITLDLQELIHDFTDKYAAHFFLYISNKIVSTVAYISVINIEKCSYFPPS